MEEDNFLEVVLSSFDRKYYSKARICWEESRKNQRINASYFFSNACFFFIFPSLFPYYEANDASEKRFLFLGEV